MFSLPHHHILETFTPPPHPHLHLSPGLSQDHFPSGKSCPCTSLKPNKFLSLPPESLLRSGSSCKSSPPVPSHSLQGPLPSSLLKMCGQVLMFPPGCREPASSDSVFLPHSALLQVNRGCVVRGEAGWSFWGQGWISLRRNLFPKSLVKCPGLGGPD